jgi:hypothetical protein
VGPLSDTKAGGQVTTAAGVRRQRNAGAPRRNGGLRGVTYKKGRWAVRIHCRGRYYELGSWETEREAGRAYDLAARRLFGPEARVNFEAAADPGGEVAAAVERALAAGGRPRKKSAGRGVAWSGRKKLGGGLRGTHFITGLWRSRLNHGGRPYDLGYFRTEVEAALAYDGASRLLRGPGAPTNWQEGKGPPSTPAVAAALARLRESLAAEGPAVLEVEGVTFLLDPEDARRAAAYEWKLCRGGTEAVATTRNHRRVFLRQLVAGGHQYMKAERLSGESNDYRRRCFGKPHSVSATGGGKGNPSPAGGGEDADARKPEAR